MKTTSNDLWRAIAFMVTVFFLFACDPTVTPGGDPDDPDDPTPMETVAPKIISEGMESVTESQATFFAWVKPNEKDTKLFLEHRKFGETKYQKKAISGSYAGTDSIKVTADLSDLSVKTEYQLRLIAINKAGSDTSTTLKISTYIVKDYDGNSYHVIKLGNQYWLQENLRATRYADGTMVPEIFSQDTIFSHCWPPVKPPKKESGVLYDSYVATSQKIFIDGFRVPTESDWKKLSEYIGGDDQGMKLLDNNNYESYNESWIRKADPNQNSTGFCAIPTIIGGEHFFTNGEADFWGQTIFNYEPYMVSIRMNKKINETLIRWEWSGQFSGFYTQRETWGVNIRLVK